MGLFPIILPLFCIDVLGSIHFLTVAGPSAVSPPGVARVQHGSAPVEEHLTSMLSPLQLTNVIPVFLTSKTGTGQTEMPVWEHDNGSLIAQPSPERHGALIPFKPHQQPALLHLFSLCSSPSGLKQPPLGLKFPPWSCHFVGLRGGTSGTSAGARGGCTEHSGVSALGDPSSATTGEIWGEK